MLGRVKLSSCERTWTNRIRDVGGGVLSVHFEREFQKRERPLAPYIVYSYRYFTSRLKCALSEKSKRLHFYDFEVAWHVQHLFVTFLSFSIGKQQSNNLLRTILRYCTHTVFRQQQTATKRTQIKLRHVNKARKYLSEQSANRILTNCNK